MTTSATSLSRCPLGCLGVTALVCSRLVTAMTGWPSALARRATPTIDPLTPEFDAMRKTSAGSSGDRANSSSTTVSSRSSEEPVSTEASRDAVQDDVAQRHHRGRDEPARAAGDLHGEGLRVAGAERLERRPRAGSSRRRGRWPGRDLRGRRRRRRPAAGRSPARGRPRTPPPAWRRERCSRSSACFLSGAVRGGGTVGRWRRGGAARRTAARRSRLRCAAVRGDGGRRGGQRRRVRAKFRWATMR